ncbi:SusC/RagA family TonB-linked outer membrane protein [Niastella populi]|uniref:SusC/RagA family TonB-linked outer membrane protein n=1 Tax=Niastella populi TaxID=550983 RepID=UPI0010553671
MRQKRLSLVILSSLILSPFVKAQTDSTPQPVTIVPGSNNYNLLYQVQPKKNSTSAVSEVFTPDLIKTNTPTFGGWLAGRVAGLHAFQTSGEPGNDDYSFLLRGQAPMVLIDGTPQSFPSINPEQIESITILKDAVATAMLGMRGGNGAILITTKKGSRNGQHIEASVQHGVQMPTQLPKFVNAYKYATLYNEALANDGLAPLYSQSDLAAYQNGSDPKEHPDVNWQKQVLKNTAPFSRYDVSISGGNLNTRYFVNLDYLHQGGLFKKEGFNTYNTNADYKRYILRSNVQVNLNKFISSSLNLFGRIQNTNQPGANTASIFTNFFNTPNNAYPVLNSDGSLGGNADYLTNIYAQSVLTGYRPSYERDFKVDLNVRGNLDVIAKGLWVKVLGAVNAYQRESTNRSKTFAVFKETTDNAGHPMYTKYGIAGDMVNTITINSQNRLFYTEFSMGYSKEFNGASHLDAIVVASNDNRMVNSELPFNYSGISAKVSYSHNDKYLFEATAGYNGTERFPKSKRYGLFPAVGLGWNIARENFVKNNVEWLNDLKLRVSGGRTGNANVGYYDYYQYYVTGDGYGFGNTIPPAAQTVTLQQGSLANPHITWEKADKISAGLEATLFNRALTFSVDYFNDKYFDLVQTPASGSSMLGTAYAQQNIGTNRYKGLELQATWQREKDGFHYFIAPNVTVLKNKVEYMAEPAWPYSYMAQTGKPVGQAYGYVADGLFNSKDEITAHAFQGNNIVPGDIRYKDLNNDGIIDGFDQQPIGNQQPFVFYGANAGIGYKGLNLTMLWQGAHNRDVQLTGYRAFQNNGKGQAMEMHENRWTPGNNNAGYPRLWVGNNPNNMVTSSYWIRSGNFLRLKNIELGYAIPQKLLPRLKVDQVRFFINATNLVTISKLNDSNIDPENTTGVYPIMKTCTAGVTIKL